MAISCANGSCSASFPTLQGNQQGSYKVHAHSAQIGNAADSDPASFILYKSLACGATDTSVDPAVQITNTNSGTNCPPTVYAASFGDNQFDLTKPNGEQITGLQVQVGAWDPEEAHNPVPPTQVSGPNPADGLHDGQWCNGTPAHPTMPGGEIWCLVSQSTMLAGTDTDGSITGTAGTQLMQVTEIWLLEGDAALCRTCGK